MNFDAEELLEQVLKAVDHAFKVGLEYVPNIEKFIIDLLDTMFAPKQIIRQIAMISALQVMVILYQGFGKINNALYMRLTDKGRKEKKLLDELAEATSYNEWQHVAYKLDELRGFDKWRIHDQSTLYDCKTLAKRINGTSEMLQRGDVFNLMFRLRGGLARDQFGMQHAGLFTRAMAGTKHIVERYHETMASALNYICDSPIADEEIPTDAKLAFFNETRHSYGRTGLLLSGGAYLGYYHMGVIKALFAEGLLPRVISGASAGSIMTALIGTHTDEEFEKLVCIASDGMPPNIRMDFFRFSDELQSEMAKKLQYLIPQGLRWLTGPIFSSVFDKKLLNLDTEHFKQALLQDVGLHTFQEAFDRTGRIINITVAPLNNYDPPRLLNYLTAPHVCVWSAAAASCAIPGIFDSVSLIVKEPDGKFRPENEWTRQGMHDADAVAAAKLASYSDGSLESDLPMQQLSELFNVNHFIVSQVNPHSAILSSMAWRASVWSNPVYRALVGYARFLKDQCRDWLKNIVGLFIFRSNMPAWSAKRGLTQTLTQEYEGREMDVTIMPWAGHISAFTALTSAIKNPTVPEYLEVLDAAQANTWPFIPRIRAHCLVEMTLDKCVQRLRKRISDESEAAHAAAASTSMQGTGVHRRPAGGKGKMDRTPSFYTSRSIVNLSGLSVADPSPIHSVSHAVRRPSASMPAATDASTTASAGSGGLQRNSSKDVLPLRLRSSSLSRAWSIGQGMNDGEASQHAAPATSEPSGGGRRPSLNARGRSGSDFGLIDGDDEAAEEDNFWNFAVQAGEVPLAPSSGLSGNVSLAPVRAPSVDHAGGRVSSSENLLREDNTIHKTTHMANFYYKRSMSTENFQQQQEQQQQQQQS